MDKKKKLKIDPVLLAAWLLAAVSAFFVHPDNDYLSYIDFRSLGILWSLMVIIQGLKENSVFERIAEKLLAKVKGFRQLVLVLVFLCFFSAMLITNDVALITFVPFSIMILINCSKKDAIIPVVVLQTVAANLGSMLTPIGNPQNLYLYGLTAMSFIEFVSCMLPYTLMAAALLIASVMIMKKDDAAVFAGDDFHIVKHFGSRIQVIIYAVLFVIAILSVLRVIPWQVMSIIVFVIVLGMDLKILFRADYVLLLTFIGFFIFTGNMGRIPQIHDILMSTVSGHEFFISVLMSQFISNVPTALLLSRFTDNYRELLLGVNIGGTGTLISSLASLITFSEFCTLYPDKKKHYLLLFALLNLLFLVVLGGFGIFLTTVVH